MSELAMQPLTMTAERLEEIRQFYAQSGVALPKEILLELDATQHLVRVWQVFAGAFLGGDENKMKSPTLCECGRAMVWEGSTAEHPGAWMCPQCCMRRVRSFKLEVQDLRDALYPLVVGVLKAEAEEDGPEFVSGEAFKGMVVLPQCQPCEGTGATDRQYREDVAIPADLVCPACEGWGFVKRPNGDPDQPTLADALRVASAAEFHVLANAALDRAARPASAPGKP